MITWEQMIESVSNMSDDELKMVQEVVYRTRKHRADSKIHEQMNAFRIGQPVEFDARGRTWKGKVVSLNDKTISVDCGNGKWRVSPQFLRAT